LFLIVVPWSVFWERNHFLDQVPPLRGLLLNHFLRGAISGIGLLCLVAAVAELWTLWRRRARGRRQQVPPVDADVPTDG
jgi:hypothetical protein